MAIDRIDDDGVLDIQVIVLPQGSNQKYQLQLTETELMEAIGRTATALFTLLHQTQPKIPPMMGVVVIKERITDVVEEVAQDDIALEVEIPAAQVPMEIPPLAVEVVEEEKTEITPPAPKFDREATLEMIKSYREQIRLMSQAAAQERQLLKTHEQIQFFQQVNRGSQGASLVDDPKVALLNRIASFEREMRVAQQKMVELQLTLKDNQGT